VERTSPLNVIIAHEIGHYLGLEHDSSAANFMNGTAVAANINMKSGQASKMKKHCFVHYF
jgi:predicted Zn-dependent protease